MTPQHRPDDSAYQAERDLVRRAFSARAERVEVAPDALQSIRDRIDRRTRQKRRVTMAFASVATGSIATAAAVLVGIASCLPPQPTPPPVGTGTAAPPPSITDGPAPTGEPTAGPTTAAGTARLPIYYLGSVGNRTVLYREFHTLPLPAQTLAGRISAAVTEMLTGEPYDPDYVSAWPTSATVRAVRIDGDVAVVDLGGVSTNNVGSEVAELTVAQLVWTVTAVAADAGAPLAGVRLLVDGSATSELWGHVAVGGVLRRGSALQTLAPVWLISPQDGDTVGRSFRVHIDGAVFEATAQLRVRDAGGTTVHEQFVTLDAGGPARGEASLTLTLEPGRYTLEAFYYSAEDGSVQAVDDHDITVR